MDNKDLTTSDIQPFLDHINDIYIGDIISINKNLGKAIYLLHYISNEDSPKEELQTVSFGLQELIDTLYACHEKKMEKKD